MVYPDSSKILPCGEKVPGRDCSKSRNSINKLNPVLVRFGPKTFSTPGKYLLDYGGTYGSTGKPFGWSKDISNRSKYFQGKSPDNPIIETMIHFPPSESSRYCKKEVKDTICDKVDWSIKAGNGKFTVKVTFGDPTVNSKIDLSLNGKEIFSGLVPKGEVKVIEKRVEAKDQFITLTSNCVKDCNYAMAKISAVEILPLFQLTKPETRTPEVEKELCGGCLAKGFINN